MAQDLWGESPHARFSPSRRLGEGQGRRREAGSPIGIGTGFRKPNPKARGDEQEPDMRCGTSGASGHVTAKPSIGKRGVLYKSGVYAQKALCLTPGDLPCARLSRGLREEQSTLTAWEKSAEGIVGDLQERLVSTLKPKGGATDIAEP